MNLILWFLIGFVVFIIVIIKLWKWRVRVFTEKKRKVLDRANKDYYMGYEIISERRCKKK